MPSAPTTRPCPLGVLCFRSLFIALVLSVAGAVAATGLRFPMAATALTYASAIIAVLMAGVGLHALFTSVRRSRVLSATSPLLHYAEAEAIVEKPGCSKGDVAEVAEKVVEAVRKLDFARSTFATVLATRNPATTPPVMLAIAAPEGLSAINEAFDALKGASEKDEVLRSVVVNVSRLATGCDRYEKVTDVLKDLSVLTQALILYLSGLKRISGGRITLTLLNKDYGGLKLVSSSGTLNKLYTFEVE